MISDGSTGLSPRGVVYSPRGPSANPLWDFILFTADGWRGSFYPKGLKPADYLAFYAERFHTAGTSAGAQSTQTRPNSSGKLFFNPLLIFSMFTSDTFLTPRSTPL